MEENNQASRHYQNGPGEIRSNKHGSSSNSGSECNDDVNS